MLEIQFEEGMYMCTAASQTRPSLPRLKVRIAGWRAVNKLDLQFTACSLC